MHNVRVFLNCVHCLGAFCSEMSVLDAHGTEAGLQGQSSRFTQFAHVYLNGIHIYIYIFKRYIPFGAFYNTLVLDAHRTEANFQGLGFRFAQIVYVNYTRISKRNTPFVTFHSKKLVSDAHGAETDFQGQNPTSASIAHVHLNDIHVCC